MTTSADRSRDAVLAAYDRQVDGLFTYCLSVLCEHDAATAALREVHELTVRHGARLAEPGLVRAWLYSLARYCCLRRMADGPGTPPATGPDPAEATRRRAELASLAWPEAAGTDAEQREALELAVRHRLSPIEVAAVLGIPFERARAVLAAAETEVGRTRAALLVLGVGSCPELDRLGGAGAESWRAWVLGPALRRELVQHVADCPTCRGTSERVAGQVGAGGLASLPGLPVLPAPAGGGARAGGAVPGAVPGTGGAGGPAVRGAGAGGDRVVYLPGVDPASAAAAGHGSAQAQGRGQAPGQGLRPGPGRRHGPGSGPGRGNGSGSGPGQPGGGTRRAGGPVPVTEPGLRFDQRGFPRHRAPDGGRNTVVRQRVVTTGVLAAVLAAPVVTLWAGHRDGAGAGATASVSSVQVDDGAAAGRPPQAVPPAGPVPGHPDGAAPAVAGLTLAGAGPLVAETLLPGLQGPVVPVPGGGATPLSSPTLVATPVPAAARPDGAPVRPAPVGLLTVEAGEYANRTVLTLTNSGGTDIHWHAVVDADWLRLSRDSGTLLPGQRITVIVTVDEDRVPDTHWTARIALPPSQAVVTLEGGPRNRAGDPSAPARPRPGGPAATGPRPAPGTGSGTGGTSSPDPSSGTSPSDPGGGGSGGTSGGSGGTSGGSGGTSGGTPSTGGSGTGGSGTGTPSVPGRSPGDGTDGPGGPTDGPSADGSGGRRSGGGADGAGNGSDGSGGPGSSGGPGTAGGGAGPAGGDGAGAPAGTAGSPAGEHR